MPSFDDLQDMVRLRLSIAEGDASADQQIESHLRQEHVRLVAEFGLLVEVADLAFVLDDPKVALPADWLRTISIIKDEAPLDEGDWQNYAADLSIGRAGQYYLQSGDELRFYPTPTETTATGATLTYVKAPVAMDDGSDTPQGVPENFHDLLAERTIYRVALTEEEPELASQAAVISAQLTEQFRTFLARRRGMGPRHLRLKGYDPR